jgi:hypothetical protein
MTSASYGLILAVVLFLGMIGLVEVGRRIAHRRRSRDAEGADEGLGVVEAAVF